MQIGLTEKNFGWLITKGLRPFIPNYLPESINKSIDINHRV